MCYSPLQPLPKSNSKNISSSIQTKKQQNDVIKEMEYYDIYNYQKNQIEQIENKYYSQCSKYYNQNNDINRIIEVNNFLSEFLFKIGFPLNFRSVGYNYTNQPNCIIQAKYNNIKEIYSKWIIPTNSTIIQTIDEIIKTYINQSNNQTYYNQSNNLNQQQKLLNDSLERLSEIFQMIGSLSTFMDRNNDIISEVISNMRANFIGTQNDNNENEQYTRPHDVPHELDHEKINNGIERNNKFAKIFVYDDPKKLLQNAPKRIHYTKIEKGKKIKSPEFTGCVMAAFKFNYIIGDLFEEGNHPTQMDTYVAHVYQGGDIEKSTLAEFYNLEEWGVIKILKMFRPATKEDKTYRVLQKGLESIINHNYSLSYNDAFDSIDQSLKIILKKSKSVDNFIQTNRSYDSLSYDNRYLRNDKTATGYMYMDSYGKIIASTEILGTEMTYGETTLQKSTDYIRAELKERAYNDKIYKTNETETTKNIKKRAKKFVVKTNKKIINKNNKISNEAFYKISVNDSGDYYYKYIINLEDETTIVVRVEQKAQDNIPNIYKQNAMHKLITKDFHMYIQDKEFL